MIKTEFFSDSETEENKSFRIERLYKNMTKHDTNSENIIYGIVREYVLFVIEKLYKYMTKHKKPLLDIINEFGIKNTLDYSFFLFQSETPFKDGILHP